MYFFFHLVTGIILGLLAAELLHDRRWVLPCAIGSVLPDLIDKPIGHLLFPVTIGYGRIYAHTLLFCCAFFILGLLVLHYKKSPVVLPLALGILSHQILDLMWLQPRNWFYPFMGPFKGHLSPDYWYTLFRGELGNIPELVLALMFGIGFILAFNPARVHAVIAQHRKYIAQALLAGALILLILSGIMISYGLLKTKLPYTGWNRPEEYLIGGIVFALASYIVWRWGSTASRELPTDNSP